MNIYGLDGFSKQIQKELFSNNNKTPRGMTFYSNDTLSGFRTVQFKDGQYTLGVLSLTELSDSELIDINSFNELLGFFASRNERDSYCCDNYATFGIIRNLASQNLRAMKFTQTTSTDMYIYIVHDDESNNDIILYSDHQLGGVGNPNIYTL